jgi:Glycosyltransferase Family 4
MRIACASIYDAQDPAAFGGRVYESLQSIKRRVDRLYFLGPLNTGAYKPMLRIKGKYYRRVQRKTYFPERDRLSVRSYARQLSKRLSKVEADIVFSPESPYSQPIAYLECAQPIVIWTDATFAGASRLYDEYRPENLCRESFRDAIENERAALTRAAALIYSSDWAAQTAIHEYAVSSDKISVIPFGPASDIGIANFEEARAIIDARPRDRCRLLFVGLDWVRKGGSTVLEVAKRLNARGLKTELSIIGSYPDLREALPKFAQTDGIY